MRKARAIEVIAIGLIALCLFGLIDADAARAEGLFDFLFGNSEPEKAAPTPTPAQQRRMQRRGAAPRDEIMHRRKNDGAASNGEPMKRAGHAGASPAAGGYCVRSCDGYFFPLIKWSRATGQQSCEFLCPTAPVELYTGASIETARNAKGERYAALPTAFSFRDKAIEKCACNDPAASADNPRRADPTLRSGDVVIEDGGAFVYNGASLVTLGNASFLSGAYRQRLRSMLLSNRSVASSTAEAPQITKPRQVGRPDTAANPAPLSRPANRPAKPVEAQGAIEFVAPSKIP